MKRTPAVSIFGVVTCLFLLLAGFVNDAFSQTVVAEATPTSLAVGESFIYRVTVTGSRRPPEPSLDIPSVFQIVSGPNTSLNMELINGSMSSKKTVTYRLRALREGRHVIPAPTVKVKRKTIPGNNVAITVSKAGSPNVPGNGKSATENRSSSAKKLPDIFLRAEIEPSTVYFQQPIKVNYVLYFRMDVKRYDVQKLPSTEGFWTEKWPTSGQPDVYQKNVNGQRYNAAVLHRTILFPSKTGKLTIGPMEIVASYSSGRNRSRSMFDSFFDDPFFGGGMEDKMVASQPITIDVKPLPEKDKPADFQNVVGKYSMNVDFDTTSVTANESVTLSLRIQGRGNIGFIPTPELKVSPDIEMYEPQVTENHEVRSGDVLGYKEFKYLLIPRRAGKQSIAPISFSYFDPYTEVYVTRKTPTLTLDVKPASGWAAGGDLASSNAPAEVQTLGTDIRWIGDARKSLKRMGPPMRQKTGYWLAYLLPLAILGTGFSLQSRQRSLAGQEKLVKSRKAAKVAMKALKGARDEHKAGNATEGYDALAKGLIFYIADRIGAAAGSLDDQSIRTELGKRDLSDAAVEEISAIIGDCHTARFTPAGADLGSLETLIEKAEKWIDAVDRGLGKLR